MDRKRPSITLSVAEQEKAQLEQLALDFGQTWGDKPNISKLIKAIAQGKLRLGLNHNWSHDRINSLSRTLAELKDAGQVEDALVLAHLLLERSELNLPLREEIQNWIDKPRVAWRMEIDRCIRQQMPFRLVYQDAADRPWHFTVRHAVLNRYEDRPYLDCWCDETEGNQDIELLCHNWSLRLDRIPEEVVISPAQGYWQPELSFVDVEIHCLGSLVFGYRSKTSADVVNEWLPDRQIRRVVRRIHNTFWFFREIRRYGADCVVVEPDLVRDRFVEDLQEMLQNYAG